MKPVKIKYILKRLVEVLTYFVGGELIVKLKNTPKNSCLNH